MVRGVYDTSPDRAWRPADQRCRIACIALLAMGPDAIAVGQCALALHGIAGLPTSIPPEVALPGGRSTTGPRGVVVRRVAQVPVRFRFVRWSVSDVPTALVHALPSLPRRHAVAVVDSALNKGLIDRAALAEIRRRLRGRRGARVLKGLWPLVDGRAASPLETWARLDCAEHGMPPDDLQVVVRDHRGRFLARADLGWRRSSGGWVLVEMDGHEFHSDAAALYADRRRQNRLLMHTDSTLLRFTAADLDRPGAIAATVNSALHER